MNQMQEAEIGAIMAAKVSREMLAQNRTPGAMPPAKKRRPDPIAIAAARHGIMALLSLRPMTARHLTANSDFHKALRVAVLLQMRRAGHVVLAPPIRGSKKRWMLA